MPVFYRLDAFNAAAFPVNAVTVDFFQLNDAKAAIFMVKSQ